MKVFYATALLQTFHMLIHIINLQKAAMASRTCPFSHHHFLNLLNHRRPKVTFLKRSSLPGRSLLKSRKLGLRKVPTTPEQHGSQYLSCTNNATYSKLLLSFCESRILDRARQRMIKRLSPNALSTESWISNPGRYFTCVVITRWRNDVHSVWFYCQTSA
jgi:hypothetical protein